MPIFVRGWCAAWLFAISACGRTVDLDQKANPGDRRRALDVSSGMRIRVDSEHVSWIGSYESLPGLIRANQFGRCRKDDCFSTRTTVNLERDQMILDVAVGDGAALLQTTDGGRMSIRRCDLAHCGSFDYVVRTAQDAHQPWGFGGRDHFVYWAGSQGVYRCPDHESCAAPELWRKEPALGTTWFAGDSIFWEAREEPAQLSAARFDTGAPATTVLTRMERVRHLTATASSVFVVAGGMVFRCSADDCAADRTPFTTIEYVPLAVAADSRHFYWLNYPDESGAAVWRCAVSDCGAPERVEGVSPKALDFALDDTDIWWITEDQIDHIPK